MAKGSDKKHPNGSALDFEAQLWAAADKTVGVAGFVMANGSMLTQTLNEREALPGQLFL